MANLALSKNPIVADPQRNYQFEVVFVELPTDIGETSANDLTVRATSCVIPSRGNGVLEVPFYQMKAAFPGKPTFGDNKFSITFNEFEDKKVSNLLYQWQEKIFASKTTGASLAADKANICAPTVIVTLLNFKGEPITGLTSKVNFKNVWIENVDEVPLSWTEEGLVTYNATFHFDWWQYS
jgi:hypothetical protein